MKIKSLELHGFKSFPDRTEVEFHEGMTAIVGPNGCGKSNISDAIRWVLGEQAPSAIRGSRMEEAIFGGTEIRKPISRAEVSLTLSNEDRVLPVPYSEVVIGRTVYRGGESEYRLNGEVCRLRDIQDLCRDTGLGATEYAVIEGRMIDAILSDRAEERRALFEEAAEIGRYKDRRRTALRRLEQARDDLSRLEDVIGEVQTKVRSLAQQRGRAERYREYRERRLRLEVAVARARLEDLAARIEDAQEELEDLRKDQPAEESELQERETRAETLRVEIAELERERSRQAGELEQVRDRLEERERRRLVASERASAAERRIEAIGESLRSIEERRSELREEIAGLEDRVSEERERVLELRRKESEAEEAVGELGDRLEARRASERQAEERLTELVRRIRLLEADRESGRERIEERTSELDRRRDELEAAREAAAEVERELHGVREDAERAEAREEDLEDRLEEATGRLEERRKRARELRDRVSALEGELSAARSRAESLASLVGSGEELPPAVSRLLEELGPGDGVRGVLADSLTVPSELAAAVEASLGAYLQGVVVDDWEAVRRVQTWLRRESDDEGGLLLLPRDPGPRGEEGASPAEGTSPGGGGLLERVSVEGPGAAWARALLRGVSASSDGDLTPRPGPWTRPDGTGQNAVGAVRLGRPAASRGLLERRAELSRLRDRIQEQASHLEELRERREEAEEAADAAAERVESLESASSEASKQHREVRSRLEGLEDRRERAKREVGEIEERIQELEEAVREARERAREVADRLGEARQEKEEVEATLEAERERAAKAREAWEEERGELHELQLRLTRREAELEGAEDRLESARSSLEELGDRRGRLEEEREEQRRERREADEAADESEELVADLLDRRSDLKDAVDDLENRLSEKRGELEEAEEWLRSARRAEREHAERRHELELQLAELRGKRTNIVERIEGEWEETFEELADRVEDPEEGTPAEWSEELEEVRRKLNRLGPVNLLAAEEYEEEKERLDFLLEQREDLEEARDDLHDSIRRINRAAAEAFEETFDEIRGNFQRTFETLFEGGECDLSLEDPDDPLDATIEISASPRGKRTQRIHLLSGGERALTALALLFAIYLAKPSPFCIMDEVDAPLDETNITRFIGMLEGFKDETQFIIITHNPRTIESADWIYGVTMEEPGVSSVVGVEFSDLPQGQVA